jgi:hypothetical protein
MITLYDFGNSVCCLKVRVTLCEKGLEWQAIKVDLFRSEQYDPNYLKLNPKGVVPTLVHDGKPVIEIDLDLRIYRRNLSRTSPCASRPLAPQPDAPLEQDGR